MGYYDRARFVRVTFGNRVFESGDGLLSSVTVTLGEDKRASSCEIEIVDPGLAYAGEKFLEIERAGGIIVAPEVLEDPQPPPPAVTAGSSSGGGSVGAPTGGSGFSPGAASNEQAIIAECVRQGVTDVQQIAYILGTAKHESDNFNTLEEYASGSAYEGRSDLGNTQPGDGVRFKGRGYVQLTGRVNYEKYSQLLGVDLLGNPEQLSQNASMSAFILVDGMRNGTYTGRRLGEFIGGGSADYNGARRIVNGMDRSGLIAGYAQDYEARLRSGDLAGLLGGTPVAATPAAPVVDATETTTEPVIATPPALPSEDLGTEIIVELGFENADQVVAYHFIHVGIDVSFNPPTVTIRGTSIRWLLDRRKKSTAYEDITLRELAQQFCDNHGLTLEMNDAAGEPFDGVTYSYLNADGLSDFRLLLRECRALGLRVFDRAATLVIEPRIPHYTGVAIATEDVINLDWQDSAVTERRAGATIGDDSTLATTSEPETDAGKTTAAIDPYTSEVVEISSDDPTGAGAAVRTFTTGSSEQTVTGTLKANAKPTAAETRSAVALQAPVATLATDVTGLPVQKSGVSDLADDGTATAEEIPNEQRRVKGMTGTLTLSTTYPILTFVPGSVFAIAPETFETEAARLAFGREYRAGTVRHTFATGQATVTSVEFYSPQKAAPEPPPPPAAPATGGGSTTAANGATVTTAPSDLNAAIAAAAAAYVGTSTTAGPDGGKNACAWAVNNIIQNATGGVIGPANTVYCPTIYDWCLQPGNAVRIDPSQAMPGDIVIANDARHIGIVGQDGRVISNSSTRKAFTWYSDTNFDGAYDHYPRDEYPVAIFRLQRVAQP